MLDALRAGDDGGIEHGSGFLFLQELGSFFDDAGHAGAGFRANLLAHRGEHFFEPRDVLTSIFEVCFERLAEILVRRPFGHLR